MTGRQISTKTSPSFWGQSSCAFWRWQRRVPHSVWRRRLSIWSFVANYSPSDVELGLRNVHFWV